MSHRFNEQEEINPVEAPEGTINDLCDLAQEVLGEVPDEGIDARIARRLYKDTSCGISFFVPAGNWGVVLSGYAEGTDAECRPIELRYPFPADEFWKAVEDADEEGCELFDATHCEKCGAEGLCPVEDGGICEECAEDCEED